MIEHRKGLCDLDLPEGDILSPFDEMQKRIKREDEKRKDGQKRVST